MILMFIISLLSFFFAPGYKIRGYDIMTPGGCRVSPSRIRRTLTSHLPGGYVATGFFGWLMLYGKIVVGFLFGCKIDDVGEIRGFRI